MRSHRGVKLGPMVPARRAFSRRSQACRDRNDRPRGSASSARRRAAGRAPPVDGTYPSGTAAYGKRNISELVAIWDPDTCIQCGNCTFVCPHSGIRTKFYVQDRLRGPAESFLSVALSAVGLPDTHYTLQVCTADCTGCGLCVEACPVIAPGTPLTKASTSVPANR